jgi:hypothetical protein
VPSYRNRAFYVKDDVRIYPAELAATGIYLALCVDANKRSMKRVFGLKKWRFNLEVYWKLDIYELIKTLAEHGVIKREDTYSDELFYMVRNGYIQLRRTLMKRKNNNSLETLVTSIVAKTKPLLEKFCRDFPLEAEQYILKEIKEKYIMGVINAGSNPS